VDGDYFGSPRWSDMITLPRLVQPPLGRYDYFRPPNRRTCQNELST